MRTKHIHLAAAAILLVAAAGFSQESSDSRIAQQEV